MPPDWPIESCRKRVYRGLHGFPLALWESGIHRHATRMVIEKTGGGRQRLIENKKGSPFSDLSYVSTITLPSPYIRPGTRGSARAGAIPRCPARRFLLISGSVYLAGLAVVVAFSVFVNCWGSFGKTGFLDIRQYNDRMVKVDYLDRLSPSLRPEILLLGSSNLMGIRARDLQRRTGKRVFNAYMSGAMAEDHLCMIRHLLLDLHHHPEALIVGLETWTFHPPGDRAGIIPSLRRPLANVPQLVRHHPDCWFVPLYWSKLVECFSPDQLAASWRVLTDPNVVRQPWAPLEKSTVLQPDGALVPKPNTDISFAGTMHRLDEHGEFDVTAAIQETIDQGKTDKLKQFPQFDFDGLWQHRIELFEQFLSTCESNDVRVVLVVNPIHPALMTLLDSKTPHLKNQRQLLQLTRRWEKKYSVVVGTFDASDISSFGGDPDGFFDETHCGTRNSKRLLAHIAGMLRPS